MGGDYVFESETRRGLWGSCSPQAGSTHCTVAACGFSRRTSGLRCDVGLGSGMLFSWSAALRGRAAVMGLPESRVPTDWRQLEPALPSAPLGQIPGPSSVRFLSRGDDDAVFSASPGFVKNR